MSQNIDNLIKIAAGQTTASQGQQVSLKTVIVNFHQYLAQFLTQQKELSSVFPDICTLTSSSFQRLNQLVEQSNYILSSSKRYESLQVSQRVTLFNKQKEWIQRAECLKKIQLNQHNQTSEISESPLDSNLYNEFLQQKKIESQKIQRENLIKKFFLKKKQEEQAQKQSKESQKVKRQLPEVPDFEEDEVEVIEIQDNENIDMEFENFNYIPMSNIDEKQYEDVSSSSFDSNSTGITDSNSTVLNDSTINNNSSIAQYKFISNKNQSRNIEIIYNNISSEKQVPTIEQTNVKQLKSNSNEVQLSNKFLQKKYSKIEECILNLIEKLQLSAQASESIFKISCEISIAILNEKDFMKNKTIEIISSSIILYASKLANYPITIKAITEFAQEKERCLNKVYNNLVNSLPQYKKVQISQPEDIIQGITSLLNVPQEILYASQYLYNNICVNGLLKGEQSSVVSASVVFISCLLNNISYPIEQYSSALQLNSSQLQNYSNFILNNSKILINNPALFKQSVF